MPVPPPEASISGPTYIDHGEKGTWTASVSGGSGSVSYDWEYRSSFSSSWVSKSCSGPSCSHRFYNTSGTLVQTAGLRSIVTKGTETDTAATTVGVYYDGDCQIACIESLSKDGQVRAVHGPEVNPQERRAAQLSWQVSGSLPPSRFVVQHRTDSTDAWTDLGAVDPADSTRTDTTAGPAYRYETDELDVGPHQFRLAYASSKVKKESGWTSPVVTASIEMESPYELEAYPNPVRERATVGLAVKKRQKVDVQVYDLLGRRVTTLHSGPLPGQETRRLPLEVSRAGLTSGSYFVRAVGEDFVATRRLTVVR